jgi:hypothetical protein
MSEQRDLQSLAVTIDGFTSDLASAFARMHEAMDRLTDAVAGWLFEVEAPDDIAPLLSEWASTQALVEP